MDEIILDKLTIYNANIKKIIDNEIWRKSYDNTESGWEQLQAEVDEPILTTILKVWATNINAADNIDQKPNKSEVFVPEPTVEEKITTMAEQLLATQEQLNSAQDALDFILMGGM
jgi:predicted nucleotidyltransferase